MCLHPRSASARRQQQQVRIASSCWLDTSGMWPCPCLTAARLLCMCAVITPCHMWQYSADCVTNIFTGNQPPAALAIWRACRSQAHHRIGVQLRASSACFPIPYFQTRVTLTSHLGYAPADPLFRLHRCQHRNYRYVCARWGQQRLFDKQAALCGPLQRRATAGRGAARCAPTAGRRPKAAECAAGSGGAGGIGARVCPPRGRNCGRRR
jgi:hypothetical protein